MTSPSQYEPHITTEYDEQFKAEKDLRWLPWVGKSFNKTRILVVGMTTDDRDEGWREYAEKDPNTSRILVSWVNEDSDPPFHYDDKNSKSFKHFSQTFSGAVGRDDTLKSRAAFWELVAFNNFIQRVVPAGSQPADYDPDDVKQAMGALSATINIIKPRLILVWSVAVVDGMGLEVYSEQSKGLLGGKSGAYPRVFKGNSEFPPIVGVQHPWLWATAENQKQWLDFIEHDPASKDPIGALLKHLSQ